MSSTDLTAAETPDINKDRAIARVRERLEVAQLESETMTKIYADLLNIADPPLPQEYKEVKFEARIWKRFLELVAAGLPDNVIFRNFPEMPHPRVVKQWRKSHKSFREGYEQAQKDSTEVLRQKKMETAFAAPTLVQVKPGVYAEDPASLKRREIEIKALVDEIKWRDSARYSRKAVESALPTKVELTVKPPGSDEVL